MTKYASVFLIVIPKIPGDTEISTSSITYGFASVPLPENPCIEKVSLPSTVNGILGVYAKSDGPVGFSPVQSTSVKLSFTCGVPKTIRSIRMLKGIITILNWVLILIPSHSVII